MLKCRREVAGSNSGLVPSVASTIGGTAPPGERSAQDLIPGGTLPNGIAFDRDGNILIANFGTDAIELMSRDGQSRTPCQQIDGQPLGKTNFGLTDSRGRFWFSVTTRLQPWPARSTRRRPMAALPDSHAA